MKTPFSVKLILDCFGLALLISSLAYYWQTNVFHEVVGFTFMALVLCHNIINRKWYTSSAKRLTRQRWGNIRLLSHAVLIITVILLLITSILLSRSINPIGPFTNDFNIKQWHQASAYWLLLMTGVHIGRNFPKIKGYLRSKIWKGKFGETPKFLSLSLWLTIVCIGAYAFAQLDIKNKALMVQTMNFWDFTNQSMSFFALAFVLVLAIMKMTALISRYLK